MLDSSPVAIPSPAVRRPLKRSASTASLLTPPRTHKKYARGRSKGSCDSDSDGDVVLVSDDEAEEEEATGNQHKKRRTKEATATEADEEAFWLADSAALKAEPKSQPQASSSKPVASSAAAGASKSAPLLYRRRAQAQADVAPVSPPPSHRKTAVITPKLGSPKATEPKLAASPPVTPRKTRSSARLAFRDSPDNPFLATPVDDSASPSPSLSSANPSPHTPTPYQEKPTVTYVFRGVRRVYQNPLYNHAEDRPLSPPPAASLPIEHPDYSPAIHITPKLLFPEARRKGTKKAAPKSRPTTRKTRQRSPSISADEADAAEIRPMKLNFRGVQGGAQTLAQELRTAGESVAS